MGQFFFAAKAFDVLEKLDPNPEYWEGKRGACIGQFQLVIAGRESRYAGILDGFGSAFILNAHTCIFSEKHYGTLSKYCKKQLILNLSLS